MPESARWLVSKGKIEEAIIVLHKIRSPEDDPVIKTKQKSQKELKKNNKERKKNVTTKERTSNDVNAEDGREWFIIELKFKKKCVFR